MVLRCNNVYTKHGFLIGVLGQAFFSYLFVKELVEVPLFPQIPDGLNNSALICRFYLGLDFHFQGALKRMSWQKLKAHFMRMLCLKC